MSAAHTADRIVAGALKDVGNLIDRGNVNLRRQLGERTLPVIVADNVATYVREQDTKGHVYAIGTWPCLAPPWDHAFIEYPNSTGNERRGVYMLGFDLARATAEEMGELNGMIGTAIADAQHQSPGETVRFALVMLLFVDDGRHVHGPLGCVIGALDAYGKELGNRWFLRPSDGWQESAMGVDQSMWLQAALIPAMQTIAFMHCKNVVVDRHARPDKLARAYRRRHGDGPLRWQTVRLELPRRYSNSGGASQTGSRSSLHIVGGHFSHYGDCCPTQHEPKGLLFGRLSGIYWMPQHLRGDPTHEVRTDRVVAPIRGMV